MSKTAGYILNVPGDRVPQLLQAISFGEILAEAVPEFLHSRNWPLVAFISFKPGYITHLARARRGQRAATGLRRLNFHQPWELPEPVAVSQLLPLISSKYRKKLKIFLHLGGLLPHAAFQEYSQALLKLCPSASPSLERFSKTREDLLKSFDDKTRLGLAYQKEAVSAAFNLAGLNRMPLEKWDFLVEEEADWPPSFLDGLDTARLREDPMITNDLMNFPGAELVRQMMLGACVFEDDETRLTITMANRLALEEQLGVDLIYYNETYRSFVMVQYKAMETGKDHNGPHFRLPNEQLTKEIKSMEKLLDYLRQWGPTKNRHGFRMTDNPFFIKLCHRLVFNPDSSGISSGMYLPLDYWSLLETDSELVGPKGGRLITFKNVGRYLDNSEFVNLVRKAWVGTSISQSEQLIDLIRKVTETGRQVILAIKSDKKKAK
jgi:hypothetical protein